jgi:hypothetical protein
MPIWSFAGSDPSRSAAAEVLEQSRDIYRSLGGRLGEAKRPALEHLDAKGDFPLPAVAIPTSGDGDGNFTFVGVHGNLDLGRLYEDARSVAAAIAKVIEPVEAEPEKAAVAAPVGG